jgi:hypothetical protein
MIGAATRGAGTDGLYETEAVRQITFDVYPSVHTSVPGRAIRLCKAGARKSVALGPAATDGVFDAWFRHQKMEIMDFNAPSR